MNRLQREFGRLFGAPDASAESIELIDGDGRVTMLVVVIARSRDWQALAGLLDGLQEILGLQRPVVAVDGKAGFQVWLPLAEPVAPDVAASFLLAVRRQFLGDIADADLALLPMLGGATRVRRIPALSAQSERWSAFIDPTMGSMFAEGGGLDFEPNPDRQAELLASVSPVEAADFVRALAVLSATDATAPASAEGSNVAAIGSYSEPRDFLLAVMNDPLASVGHRIKAAKALRPYFKSGK